MFILYNQERDINQDLYLPDIPSGYLTVRHGKWPIEIDGFTWVYPLKMVDLSMAMLVITRYNKCIPSPKISLPPRDRGRPGRYGAGKLHPPGDLRGVQPGGTDHPRRGA